MLPSFARPSAKINPDTAYDTILDPYDCRGCGKSQAGGYTQPVYPAPASVSATRPQGVRRSSEPIVSSSSHQPPPYFPSDGANSSEWVFHHHHHHPNRPSQPAVENYSLKQLEHPVEAQGSFTDVTSSINNTRNFNHMDPSSYVSPQYPPPYTESLAGWNDPSYDMQPYYDQQVSLQYPMDTTPDQINYDQQPMPDSLHHVNGYSTDHHHHPSSLNQTHVSNNNHNNLQHLNLPTAAGSGQSQLDVTAAPYLIPSGDPVVPRVFDHHGCVDVPQLTVHSEQPPLSSYSELSAHMKYYSTFNSPSQPTKATTTLGQSQPHPVTTTSAWKGSNHASSQDPCMDTLPPQPAPQTLQPPPPPPPPSSSVSSISSISSISRTFEPWTAPPSHQRKHKSEVDPLTSLAMSKRFGSPDRSARSSSSSESRRSRTLSPSSRSQGVLKTIMMKRGGSEPKKQNLACLFCRERKIACGRPVEGSLDPTCNQCARRSLVCQYPTESRRGQHKRSKKNQQDHGHTVDRAK